MGVLNQAFRNIKRALKGLLGGNKKKKRRQVQETKIPRSWVKDESPAPKSGIKKIKITKHRVLRIPGFLWIKRIIAGFLLLINFVFSQFLLGSLGEGAQPMFVLFLLNSFIIADYLWKTRRKAEK